MNELSKNLIGSRDEQNLLFQWNSVSDQIEYSIVEFLEDQTNASFLTNDQGESIMLPDGNVSKPTICNSFQPWKIHSEEAIVTDLMGCILKFYNKYSPNVCYTVEEALSDAYGAIKKSIERDSRAPTIAGKTLACPQCEGLTKMPPIMPGDKEMNMKYSDPNVIVTVGRTFHINCPHCGLMWVHEVPKTVFSTFVFQPIRAAIQAGVRQARNRHTVSLDAPFSENSESGLGSVLGVEHGSFEPSVETETRRKLYQGISALPPRYQEVLSRMFGLEYDGVTYDPMNQTEVAEFLGISKQRVHGIFKESKRRIMESGLINEDAIM